MDTNPEIRERILAAAQTLFEQSGRKELPTVDAVRKLSKTSMNDASAVVVDLVKQRQEVTEGKPRAAFVVTRQITNTCLLYTSRCV